MTVEKVEIRRIEHSEIGELSELATKIVRDHFDPIIGKEQNDYMLKLFQSVEGITKQFHENYQYYWVIYKGETAGFFAIVSKKDYIYLSKFYIRKMYRGNHLAAKMLSYIIMECKLQEKTQIVLNVNRENTTVIDIYQHLGFHIIREEKNDIGNGYYMDDYVLALDLRDEGGKK